MSMFMITDSVKEVVNGITILKRFNPIMTGHSIITFPMNNNTMFYVIELSDFYQIVHRDLDEVAFHVIKDKNDVMQSLNKVISLCNLMNDCDVAFSGQGMPRVTA